MIIVSLSVLDVYHDNHIKKEIRIIISILLSLLCTI